MSERRYPTWTYKMGVRILKAERRLISAAMAWQEYNDRIGSCWVHGSNISKVLTACRALRKSRQRKIPPGSR